MTEYYFTITCKPKRMAEYYFIITGIHMIWQSMTLLLLVSLRYGRVLHYYNWYP